MKLAPVLHERLEYLKDWFDKHGPSYFDNAEDWINSMSNMELIEHLMYGEAE